MTKPNCAILLAVYNGMDYLEEQLKTILAQQEVSLTVFVSVDLSTDGSEAWLSTIAKTDQRIILLPYGQRFGGAAPNFLRLIRDVDFSAFDYIAFADQDDLWFEDKLIRACRALETKGIDGYSSNVEAFWSDGQKRVIHKAQPQKQWDFLFEAAGPGCTYVFTQKLMMAIKRCLESNWKQAQALTLHDWFCYAFARANGYQWFIDPVPTMRYRQHAHNQVGTNLGFKAGMNRIRKIRDGWWFSQSILVAELVGMKESRFIQGWSDMRRSQMLRLASQSFQCRRRFSEQLFFMLVCVSFAIVLPS